jgi:hypothetical protein
MGDLLIRTEDIRQEDILDLFVENEKDRQVINALKGPSPILVVGSRGVGKSFLLRVAQAELTQNFIKDRVLPVYVSFNKSSLIQTTDPRQFQHWMLARLCARIIRTIRQAGLANHPHVNLGVLAGGGLTEINARDSRIETITKDFEESWKTPGLTVDVEGLPSIEDFKDSIEDICRTLKIRRISVFIDEAAHIFLSEQQREFFTLFRDLRSPYLTCNAAIYPGVTSFGETFQAAHDATMMSLDRDILSPNYVPMMKEIVMRQANSELAANLTRNGQNFSILAYAASGNPRILLKTVARAPKVNSLETNEVIRGYYRSDIWSEHTLLGEKYIGHRVLIDWGRNFIENDVLLELQKKNVQYIEAEKKSSCFFWVHRDAPQPVKEALRILSYTGIVGEHATGIKATRSEIGTRYAVNLGCLFSLESTPAASSLKIAQSLTPKRMTEYGMSHQAYQTLLEKVPKFIEPDMSVILETQLKKSIEVLDLTNWQKEKLRSLKLFNIGDVLRAPETKLQEASYVGTKRSRKMHNVAEAAVYEYLSG